MASFPAPPKAPRFSKFWTPESPTGKQELHKTLPTKPPLKHISLFAEGSSKLSLSSIKEAEADRSFFAGSESPPAIFPSGSKSLFGAPPGWPTEKAEVSFDADARDSEKSFLSTLNERKDSAELARGSSRTLSADSKGIMESNSPESDERFRRASSVSRQSSGNISAGSAVYSKGPSSVHANLIDNYEAENSSDVSRFNFSLSRSVESGGSKGSQSPAPQLKSESLQKLESSNFFLQEEEEWMRDVFEEKDALEGGGDAEGLSAPTATRGESSAEAAAAADSVQLANLPESSFPEDATSGQTGNRGGLNFTGDPSWAPGHFVQPPAHGCCVCSSGAHGHLAELYGSASPSSVPALNMHLHISPANGEDDEGGFYSESSESDLEDYDHRWGMTDADPRWAKVPYEQRFKPRPSLVSPRYVSINSTSLGISGPSYRSLYTRPRRYKMGNTYSKHYQLPTVASLYRAGRPEFLRKRPIKILTEGSHKVVQLGGSVQYEVELDIEGDSESSAAKTAGSEQQQGTRKKTASPKKTVSFARQHTHHCQPRSPSANPRASDMCLTMQANIAASAAKSACLRSPSCHVHPVHGHDPWQTALLARTPPHRPVVCMGGPPHAPAHHHHKLLGPLMGFPVEPHGNPHLGAHTRLPKAFPTFANYHGGVCYGNSHASHPVCPARLSSPMGVPGQPFMGAHGQPFMRARGQPFMGQPGQPFMGAHGQPFMGAHGQPCRGQSGFYEMPNPYAPSPPCCGLGSAGQLQGCYDSSPPASLLYKNPAVAHGQERLGVPCGTNGK